MMNIDTLLEALRRSWSAETAYDARDWTTDNPARGQCVVSALVIQDYLAGDLQRYEVIGDEIQETHYVNLLDSGAVLDSTASQYQNSHVQLTPTKTNLKGFSSIRDKRLSDESTRLRYELLKERVRATFDLL